MQCQNKKPSRVGGLFDVQISFALFQLTPLASLVKRDFLLLALLR